MAKGVWSGVGPVLVDTSAWTRSERDPRARELLAEAAQRGEVSWCWPVRHELTVDAPGPAEIATVDRTLENLREIPVDRSVQRAVLAIMRELAADGSHGAHRLPLTDLTVAAAAQAAGVDILHFDRHLALLGDHLGVAAHWIADPAA